MNSIIYNKYTPFFLFSFLFSLNERLSTLALLTNLFLVAGNIKNININKLFYYSPLLILYFFFSFIEFVSSDIVFNSNVEQKASFLLFPLLFSSLKIDRLTVKRALNFFVIGNVVAVVLIFLKTIFNFHYLQHGESVMSNDFFVEGLFWKLNLDPIYQSLLFVLSIAYVVSYKSFNKKANIIICIILLFGVYFCQSVFGFGSLLIIFIYYIYLYRIKIAIISVVSCSILIILNYETLFQNRLVVWEASLNLIKNSFFLGYGSVNSQILLDHSIYTIFYNTSETTVLKLGLNSHNQYLQLLLEGGFFLFIVFLFTLYLYMKKAFKITNIFFRLSCLLFASIIMVECIFERYVGVAAFSLFYSFTINEYFENQR